MCYQRDRWLPIGLRRIDFFFPLEVFESSVSADMDRLFTRPDKKRERELARERRACLVWEREKSVQFISPFSITLLNEEPNALSVAIKGTFLPVTFFDNLLSLQ